MPNKKGRYRSDKWLKNNDIYSWFRRGGFKAQGFSEAAFEGRPLIGICNSWSELTHCNAHLRQLAEAVRRGVWQAGGFPLEFPVMSLGEYYMLPTTMLYRNLMSMDVEESIRANPLDGVVLLGGCDKTTPGLLMGAASADVPAIMVTGGPQLKGNWRGEEVGSCTDCRRYFADLRAGTLAAEDWADLQDNILRSAGHCMVMGTASTMAVLAEALGIALPGNGAIPAVDSRRLQLAEAAGRKIVELIHEDVPPSAILTFKAFQNAIRTLHAIGGSTNGIIHLVALAGRVGIELPLSLFDELSRTTPFILNLKPSGEFLMEDFFYAGGVSALLSALSPLLHLDVPTVTGQSLGKNIKKAINHNPELIRSIEKPLHREGGLAVLYGSLAPDGALIKPTAATPELLVHEGQAIVFENPKEMDKVMMSSDSSIRAEDVLILRNSGPIGGPGMPEWGWLPLPKYLLEQGVRDMVRVSDARMSGTGFGTVVLHVSPEASVGGPLAAVKTGDKIRLDVPNRNLELLVEDREIKRRISQVEPVPTGPSRGYEWLYKQHILQANQGCDFDFLKAESLKPIE